MPAQQVVPHGRGVGKVDQRETRVVHGTQHVAVGRSYKDEVAGAHDPRPAVDLVLARASLDPKQFGKVVRVKEGRAVGQEKDNGEVMRVAGANQGLPTFSLKHINIA